jgi:hypothetical protein
MKNGNTRLIRWKMKLQGYDYEIIHRSGRKHQNVDILSRIGVINVIEYYKNEKLDWKKN